MIIDHVPSPGPRSAACVLVDVDGYIGSPRDYGITQGDIGVTLSRKIIPIEQIKFYIREYNHQIFIYITG
jgi:hypothetical protein